MQKSFDSLGMGGMNIPPMNGMPGIEFINLSNPFGAMPEEMQERHKVKTKKKSEIRKFKDAFVPEDILPNIVSNVLIPASKKMIFDVQKLINELSDYPENN